MYDTTNMMSFQNVATWMKQIEEFAPPNVVKLLVGNKNDLVEQRQVSYEVRLF